MDQISDEGFTGHWRDGAERYDVKIESRPTGEQVHKQALFKRKNHSIFVFRQAPPIMERQVGSDVSVAKLPRPPYVGAVGWECSAYYYWWRFLREHQQLRDHITSGVELKPGTVAFDFRRIFELNFRDWWETEGRYLFCEPRENGIEVVMPPVPAEGLEDRLLVSIPFRGDIEQTLAGLRKLLSENADAFKSSQGVSRARYPVIGKPVLPALHKRYQVLRLGRENPGMTQPEIADALDIKVKEDYGDADSNNRKAAIVSRYKKEAQCLVHYAAMGLFPVLNPKKVSGIMWRKRPTC